MRITLFVLIFTLNCLAQNFSSTAGAASNLFLRFGATTRVAALAESFTALADDENTLFYNPGGIPNIRGGAVALNHTEWFQDIRVDNLIFAYAFNRNLGMSFGLSHMWMPEIQGKDQFGQNAEMFSVSSSIANLGVGYKILPGFGLGIGLKYFHDKLATFSASGLGVDIGFYLQTFIQGLSIGAATQNLGGTIQYSEEKQKIPLTYRLGLAYNLYDPHLLFCADIVKSIDTDYQLNVGTEFVFQNIFSLRLGNKFATNEMFATSFGLGLLINKQYNFNYTFVNFSDLGTTHRVGLTFIFNSPATKWMRKGLEIPAESMPLLPPREVRVYVKANELIVSWNQVTGAQYNVYARHSSIETWQKLNSSPLSYASIKYKKPKVSGKYFFRVTVIIDNKESPYSKEINIEIK